ncbi:MULTISPECIES: hypothetical protein [unclassified Pseudomonas]|uniref:hypothetical protein n=1 Tax=unclassified Pseudomonas TaxID=196821 RepID=UPI00257C8775|nr:MULTISPECIES: hypothetical protein [unclassified Pseudomonas]
MTRIRLNYAIAAVASACLSVGSTFTLAQPGTPMQAAVEQFANYQRALQDQRDVLEKAIAARHEKALELGLESQENRERIEGLAGEPGSSGGELVASVIDQACIARFQAAWKDMALELEQLQRQSKENLAAVRVLSATLGQALEAVEPAPGE